MNNSRDCEHGRHIGKCIDFEYQNLLDELSVSRKEIDALLAELGKAARTLALAGYTRLEGAQEWKPPTGPSSTPLLDLIDALRAEIDAVTSHRDMLEVELAEKSWRVIGPNFENLPETNVFCFVFTNGVGHCAKSIEWEFPHGTYLRKWDFESGEVREMASGDAWLPWPTYNQ